MKIYPAIDIKDGKCVRLKQGVLEKSTEYGEPLDMALRWQEEGANYLHIIDLDAAVSGEFRNRELITKMVQSLKIPVQMGGGARTKEDIKIRLDEVGISRVIMGTAAATDPDLLEWALSRYRSRIAVSLDAKNGKVVTKGWVDETGIDVVELAEKVHKMGVQTIVYTDITKDGMMQGPNFEYTEQIVKKTWMNLIASGGISTLEDIKNIKGTGACGCVIGKALYDGAFTLQDALRAAK